MSDKRWTENAEIDVALALHLGACDDDGDPWTACPLWAHHLRHARAALATLADLGLLLPPRAERANPDDWPAAAEGIATRAIREALPDIAISAPNMIARRIMADLVAADLLAVPGESEQEWGVRYPGLHPWPVICADETMAYHTAAAEAGRKVYVRTIHTGPWREVITAGAEAP